MKFTHNKEQIKFILKTAKNKLFGIREKDKYLEKYPVLDSIFQNQKKISIYGNNGVGKSTLCKQLITDEVQRELKMDNIQYFITLHDEISENEIYDYLSLEFNNKKIRSNDYSKRLDNILQSFYCRGLSLNNTHLTINFIDYIETDFSEHYLLLPSIEIFYYYYHPDYYTNHGFMKGENIFKTDLNSKALDKYGVFFLTGTGNNSDNDFINTIQHNLQNMEFSLEQFLDFLAFEYKKNELWKTFLNKTKDNIYINGHLYEGGLRFSYIERFIDFVSSSKKILKSLNTINETKQQERKIISKKIEDNNKVIYENFKLLKPILIRHFSHIFDDIDIYPVFCPFYNINILSIHLTKYGNIYTLSKFIKILNSADSKIILLIKMFLITPKHSSCLILFDDFFSSLDNQNIYNISSFLLDVFESNLINNDYKFLNFTHDITVFKKINQIFSLPYKNKNISCSMYSLHNTKKEGLISLELKDFQVKKNFYIDYVKKEKFEKICPLKNIVLILISLPYLRGIIQDIYGENNSDYYYITNYLHYKEKNLDYLKIILNSDYFNNMNCFFNNREEIFSTIDSYSNYWEMLEDCYIYISSKESINIEDSLFLSLYSRIYIEKEILLILTDSEELDLEDMNRKYPYNQTAMLIDEYKKKYPLQLNIIYEIECIKKIFSNFMHINSTEYQYIVNISHVYILNTIKSLKKLFIEAKK